MSSNQVALPDVDVNRVYAALRSELNNLSVQNIRNTVAAAGFDVTRIPAESEARGGAGSRAEVMPAVDRLFGEMARDAQLTAISILAERLMQGDAERAERIRQLLLRHGFEFINGTFVPVGLFDSREAAYIPPSSGAEQARAMSRLVSGDESGAITSACGAVDLATQSIYERHGFGNPGQVAFQAKVNTALQNLRVFEEMRQEFEELGIAPADAATVVEDMRRATNHAAQALQTLRRVMGDVHGTRPALRRTAYDCIKWASAVCGLLEGR